MRARALIVAAATATLTIASLPAGLAQDSDPDSPPRPGAEIVDELQQTTEEAEKTAEELAAIDEQRAEAREMLAVLDRAVERARQRLAVAQGQLALSRQAHQDALARTHKRLGGFFHFENKTDRTSHFESVSPSGCTAAS